MTRRALTPVMVSELYSVPLGSLANMRWKKEGPKFHRRGRAIVYFVEDIEAWLRSEPVHTIDSAEASR